MTTKPLPLGLHVHLVGTGPTLRFVFWIEAPMVPDAPQVFKALVSDIPFDHPAALRAKAKVPGLPKSLPAVSFLAKLPRLGSCLPIPLPGLITEWDLTKIKFQNRAHNESPYYVEGWVVPPALSLQPLKRFVHTWSEQYGPGCVSPHARAVLQVIDELHGALREGPLLPTETLPPDAWKKPPEGTFTAVDVAGPLTWVPPCSLNDLLRLRASLASEAFLPATTGPLPRRDAWSTWTDDPSPARFLRFVIEVLGDSARRGLQRAPEVSDDSLRQLIASGDVARLHRAHGSCLHPDHTVFRPPTVPPGHLHGTLHVVDAKDTSTPTWEMQLGLQSPEKAWIPLSAMVDEGTLHDGVVERDEGVWFRPASVLERDWAALARDAEMRHLLAPELLVAGKRRMTEPEVQRALQKPAVKLPGRVMNDWLDEIGARDPHERRSSKQFTAWTVAPAQQGTVRLRLRWEMSAQEPGPGEERPALQTVRFVPQLRVAVGDAELLAADAEKLLKESSAQFVKVHGRAVAREEFEEVIELLRAREKVLQRLGAEKEGVPWSKAVELDDEWSTDAQAALLESIFASRWEDFLKSLRDGTRVPTLDVPEGFKGSLRPYQQRGLSWLSFLVERGFGGCLADDMGLGKTVQVLALLAHRRRAPAKKLAPALVVCPTAVVINWSREARRFTPHLKVYVHQGAERALDADAFKKRAESVDVVVTSYALIRRDRALFEAGAWDVVVADEAHNLKNPAALQTRALKALPSDRRLALTGTPVENHLTDLWSIYDFTMPGLLGGTTRFARTFMTPLRRGDPQAMERLQRRVGPFLLRRTKDDPTVAADLPPKQEQETWCDLTREQVALYQAMTEATLEGLADRKGIQRRAHILAALTRFKQICNHPENFKADRPDHLFGRSGKLDRLMELVEELVMESQATLIFTQFAEMGRILQRAIYEKTSIEVDFYHGGLAPKEREEIVAYFNDPSGPPLLIVSLKAGGTGLNLTRASAVIHYDRWWNPAVEDQATDRAHRIGQTRSVNVYKFVTRGTLEERIMSLLESKRELAEQVLGASDDSWITEMNDRELKDFLALGSTAEESDDVA